MRCPHCGNIDDKVIESRQNSSGTSIRRRRECLKCHYRYTSYEKIEEKPFKVVKRDGRREVFDIAKLENGLQKSLEKRRISQNSVEHILHEIEDKAVLKAGNKREITSKELGDMVLSTLYSVDPIAYVRFASVYRMFDNIDQFLNEIEKLSKGS
ncbi:MAG: transcriptional regulator NrdR [Spirochaetia bacterium]|nr:transcriptional regulator NrdR [Spirochaetia bacterium]MCF7946314.1 transcriptional regulator NrdR [Spirochaetia bacterium]